MTTTVSQEAVEVTQADRDAALPILCHLYVRKGEEPALFIGEVRAGKYDDHYLVQAFARHRFHNRVEDECHRLRSVLRWIADTGYVDHQSGNQNFEHLQSIARDALTKEPTS